MVGHRYVSSTERYRSDNLEDHWKELEKYHSLVSEALAVLQRRSSGKQKKVIDFATKYSYICVMTKKEKLIARFLSMPNDFHYNEAVKLLGYFNFKEVKKGKTSGSRVKFINDEGVPIMLHKPHPSGIMKRYQLKQIKEVLGL